MQRGDDVGDLAVGPHGGFAGDGPADALEGGHGSQGHDERHESQQADQPAVDQPAQAAGHEAAGDCDGREGQGGYQGRGLAPEGHLFEALPVEPRDRSGGECDGGSGREIDASGDDDQRHAQRGDSDQRSVIEHHLQALGGEELRLATLAARDVVLDGTEDQGHQNQAQQRAHRPGEIRESAVVAAVGVHATAPSPPIAQWINDSSDHSDASRTSCNLPRASTAIRSQTASNSGV